jgi:hypothetical protein
MGGTLNSYMRFSSRSMSSSFGSVSTTMCVWLVWSLGGPLCSRQKENCSDEEQYSLLSAIVSSEWTPQSADGAYSVRLPRHGPRMPAPMGVFTRWVRNAKNIPRLRCYASPPSKRDVREVIVPCRYCKLRMLPHIRFFLFSIVLPLKTCLLHPIPRPCRNFHR